MAAWPVLFSLLILFAACAPVIEREAAKAPDAPPPADRLNLVPAGYDDLPGWNADRQGEALRAFLRSCDKMLRRKPEAAIGGVIPGSNGAWRGACPAGSRTG